MTTTTNFLPLSDDQALVLRALRDGDDVTWASGNLLGRLRNLGLIVLGFTPEEITSELMVDPSAHPGKSLTPLGRKLADVLTEHHVETTRKPLGRATIAGSAMRYGMKARCRGCSWKWETNESGADGKRRVRAAVATHTAEMVAATS